MGIKNKIAQYKEYKSGVKHCTFDPEGPGVVRIHLIPPKFKVFGNPSYIVILNGYYLLPLGYSWAVMLSEFIKEVNKYDGRPISESDGDSITRNTVKNTHKIYRSARREDIEDDLREMLDVIFDIAQGGRTDRDIEKLSIRSYSANMTAPHRVDLTVSAMTDDEGKWKCNQKCKFCYAAGQELGKTRELSGEKWKKAIDRLRDANVPMLTFTGGEPTQRDDLAELINYARPFVTRLNTNGVNLTEALVKDLKAASLDSVQITLYSHDSAVHNALVGSEHFGDTVNGIKNAVAAGLDVSINTPLCRLNADYTKTLEFIHALGVRFVTVSGLICTGSARTQHESFDLGEDELYGIVRDAKSFCDGRGMEIDFTSPGLIEKEKLDALGLNVPSCGAALSNMAIAPDGSMIPCQSWLCTDASLGNILTDSFKTIWNSKTCKKLRSMSDKEALGCPFRERGKEAVDGK